MDDITPLDLNQTHELYRELEPIRRRSRDLVGGSVPVKKGREEYLFRTQNESQEQYDHRLKRAVYDNWPRVVLDSRQALLWNKSPTRELPASVRDQERNVDGRGTFADAFFQSVSEAASIDGISWVLVDAPRESSSGAPAGVLTRRDEQEMGLSARFVHLLAADVLDWSWGEDALLDYVVIRQDIVERPGPGVPPTKVCRRLVWERDRWRLFRGDAAVQGGAAATASSLPGVLDRTNAGAPRSGLRWVLESEGPNELGVVPIVPFYGIFATDGLGWPVVVDILDHAVSIYNKFSDRDLTEFLSNNPIPYVIAPQNPGTIKVNQGKGIFLQSGGAMGTAGGETRCGYLEPTGGALSASRESERDLISRIFLIALKQARKATAQVQSAESIRGEGRVFSASLSATAGRLEDGEALCWLYSMAWKGDVDLNSPQDVAKRLPTGSVGYSRDFDDEVLETGLLGALVTATRDGMLSKRTFLLLLKESEVLPTNLNVDDEIRQIEDDAFAAAGSMPGFQVGAEGGAGAGAAA